MLNVSELSDTPLAIPHAAQSLWDELMSQPLLAVHELYQQLSAYEAELNDRRRQRDPDVDATLARELVVACRQLLDSLDGQTPDDTRHMVQAAVRYFIIEDDAEADLTSILGLDDDAEVVNAVLTRLGMVSYLVELQ